ncbi:MAG: DUF5011 domain-containing protein, partial [Anaerolineales bacterium]|nr:DUF5011 domain-containing protein [Anaerolineales bacterium]
LSSSTAPTPTVAELNEVIPHDGTTFEITVTTEGDGVVIATVPSGVVEDLAGNVNEASTSTDNSVTIDTTALGVELALQAGQTNPTNQNPVFIITFTDPVTPASFPINLSVSEALSPSVVSLTKESATRFTAVVTAEGDGEITAVVDADVVQDELGNPNLASDAVSIVYDTTPPTITLTGTTPITLLLNTPYEELGATAVDNIDGDVTNKIVIDAHALITNTLGTYPITYTVSDRAGNEGREVRQVNVIEPESYELYLPIIARPLPGDIQLGAERTAGITIFTPEVPLIFEDIDFSNDPDHMKIWVDGTAEPTETQAYESTTSFNIPIPTSGELHQINVTFFAGSENNLIELGTKSITVFYLPNGDFEDNSLSNTGWLTKENNLPVVVENGTLRLGDTHDVFNCNEVPYPASAQAALQIKLPQGSSYQLNVQGVVYTQDRLSDPTSNVSDAFEIVLNGNVVQRFG